MLNNQFSVTKYIIKSPHIFIETKLFQSRSTKTRKFNFFIKAYPFLRNRITVRSVCSAFRVDQQRQKIISEPGVTAEDRIFWKCFKIAGRHIILGENSDVVRERVGIDSCNYNDDMNFRVILYHIRRECCRLLL